MPALDRLPYRDTVVEVADVPKKIRLVAGDATRERVRIECVGVVGDRIDDVDAQLLRECELAAADRLAVDVIDVHDHHARR